MVAAVVYLLCALTSVLCATLLLIQYRRQRVRLLFWSSLCFGSLALNNILLFIDKVVTGPGVDLSIARTVPGLVGMALLVWGLVWDSV